MPPKSEPPAEAAAIIDALELAPHPEGGWYRETWRADEAVAADALPGRYGGPRAHGTAIYYLLAGDAFSALHRVASDEVFHHYAGDAVRMFQIAPDGAGRWLTIGSDLAAGARPQVLVRRGVWQGTRLASGGRWALLGCTVTPGFDFADFEVGSRRALLEAHPQHAAAIETLTRS